MFGLIVANIDEIRKTIHESWNDLDKYLTHLKFTFLIYPILKYYLLGCLTYFRSLIDYQVERMPKPLQSNLVNITLVYTTPSILRRIFVDQTLLVQNSLFYTAKTLDNSTFKKIRCHIKEVVNAKIPIIYVMFI